MLLGSNALRSFEAKGEENSIRSSATEFLKKIFVLIDGFSTKNLLNGNGVDIYTEGLRCQQNSKKYIFLRSLKQLAKSGTRMPLTH